MTAADFDRACAAIRARLPGFSLRYKSQAPQWLQLLGLLLKPFNPKFMTDVATTFGSTVWLPSREWAAADWDTSIEVLWHEATHVYDFAQFGWFGFAIWYAGALVLAPLSLLAPLGFVWPGFWWCALYLLAAAPWPAVGRVDLEAHGYAVSLLVRQFQGRDIDGARAIYASWLASSRYYWASWSASSADAKIRSYAGADDPWMQFVKASVSR